MKNQKQMKLGKAILLIGAGFTLFFGIIYLLTVWLMWSWYDWGTQGKGIFFMLTILFGAIAVYLSRIATTPALKDIDAYLDEIEKGDE
ncbi:MAG: hypothetical protein ACI9N9_000043 [Enterobacterales bacterium]|jgi:hypothetical protein